MSMFGVKYSKNTVRKNVTLSDSGAACLEKLAALTGLPQSHVLEIALSQPLFRMSRVFVDDCEDSRNYVAANLVQVAGGTKDYRTCHETLRIIASMVVPMLRVKPVVTDEWTPGELMAYIRYTMPRFAREECLFMGGLFDRCVRQELTFDQGEMTQLVRDYIEAMLIESREDGMFMDPKMYQMLYTIMSCVFEPNTEEERAAVYRAFADVGLALSQASVMDILR